jgi:hypothetical protein
MALRLPPNRAAADDAAAGVQQKRKFRPVEWFDIGLGSLAPSCVVVIPVYAENLSESERSALRVCLSRISGNALDLLQRRSIDIAAFLERLNLGISLDERQPIQAIAIDDSWLASIDSCNTLLLQSWFYRLFADWTRLGKA